MDFNADPFKDATINQTSTNRKDYSAMEFNDDPFKDANHRYGDPFDIEGGYLYLSNELQWRQKISNPLVQCKYTYIVKTDSKKIILAQKYTNNEKSTILVQSPSNLVKMISSWLGNIAKISAKLE